MIHEQLLIMVVRIHPVFYFTCSSASSNSTFDKASLHVHAIRPKKTIAPRFSAHRKNRFGAVDLYGGIERRINERQ